LISPVNDPSKPATGWSMFELSGVQRKDTPPLRPRSNLLFLAPALLKTIDSRPLEEVLFMRDEMANIAWAVEHIVQGTIENRLQPGAVPDAPQAALAPPSALPQYRLATDVPVNWPPLLPQRVADPPSLRLVRAAMLAADGSNVTRRAQGELLNAAAELKLFNEEIPREGVKVTRQFDFPGEFKLQVVLPGDAKGLTVAEGIIPAGQEEAKLMVKAAPDAPAGARNGLVVKATAMFQGKTPVVHEAKFNVNVVK
jgi:hypothetical protein